MKTKTPCKLPHWREHPARAKNNKQNHEQKI